MHNLTWTLVALVTISLFSTPARARCWRNQRLVKLDFEAMAKKSPLARLPKARRKALEDAAWMPLKGSFKKRTVGETVLQPWRRGALLGWIHCHNSCRIRIGLARLVKGKLKVYRRVTLPHTGWSD